MSASNIAKDMSLYIFHTSGMLLRIFMARHLQENCGGACVGGVGEVGHFEEEG